MKNKIKVTFGIIILIVGIFGSLYVGGWCMFIKPIIELCKAIDTSTLTGLIVGSTILKCIFASSVGLFIFYIGYYLGMYLILKE